MAAGPRTRSRVGMHGGSAASDAEKGAANGRRPAGRGKRRPRSLRSELPSMALLTGLYALQGVPLGLATGAIPFLLQANATGEGAASSGLAAASTFAIAAWPYASKLAWAPLVDNLYASPRWRRRSWILPTQAVSAALMWGGAGFASSALAAGATRPLTAFFFALVAAAATQDIAVDGWALTLLSRRRVGVASTCQTLGTGGGAFLSFAGLVALSDPTFCGRWFGAPAALWSLGGYLRAWGAAYALATVGLLFVRERVVPPPDFEGEDDDEGGGGGGGGEGERRGGGRGGGAALAEHWAAVRRGYGDLARVASLPAVRRLSALLLAARLAVLPSEAAASLTLLSKGVPRDALAGLAAAQLPVEWAAAAVAGRAASDATRPGGLARAWGVGYWARLACAAASAAVAVGARPLAPGSAPPRSLLLAAGGAGLATAAASALQFTCLGALYARVADPDQGGAYLTLLNTVANMGYALPKPLALAAVARWGLGPVSAVALAGGVALGGLWLCAELAALESLPHGAWRVKGGGRKR